MKKTKILLATLASSCAFALASCSLFGGGGSDEPQEETPFDFSVALESGKTTLEVGESDKVKVTTNVNDGVARSYTYKSSNASRMSVTEDGYVVAVSAGSVRITVTEATSSVAKTLDLAVRDSTPPASGGFNYSSIAGAEATAKRTEILGELEKYAVETHLTGITLFENGGYVKYNNRLEIPAKEYITGYGFGILTEGDINADMPAENEPVPEFRRYYHSAQTSDPATINAMNNSGSQVSDLSSYITSSYWGTKMNSTKNGYEWYPVLAKDGVTRPVPVYQGAANPLGLYKTWKIYVKTGDDGLKYRYNGSRGAQFDGMEVKLEDYAFVFQLLLTGVNGQSRGGEMAADKTYGIKGAQTYYNRTKDAKTMTQAKIDDIWKAMTTQDQLGIKVGTDPQGSYIQLELLNEIDSFTAMYTLSSSLYSPLPRSFIESLADSGEVKDGIINYGNYSGSGASKKSPVDNTISLGAYYLETYNDSYITFKQDSSWVERSTYPDRYKIEGIKITTYPNATQEQLYQYFYKGDLDSCGIPVSHIKDEAGQPGVRSTKGDATFKLNVNSCTQERWNELNNKLWGNDVNALDKKWGGVKPWMSNDNFLNGLYWSIDRKTFATNKGAQPSIDYFSNAYLSDPEHGVSYNSTKAHQKAVAKWHNVREIDGEEVDDYGYNLDKAIAYFKDAVTELSSQGKIKLGTAEEPTPISIHIRWMYQTDIADYGNEIKNYFETAFNNPKVCGGRAILDVKQDAVTDWQDVYNVYMKKGQFDLAFGAISGNTYNPLNFLEVLKSDNSSGFTLNWGQDTSKVNAKNPLVYDGHKWSFDALWEVSDRGGVVDEGVSVDTVKNYYFDGFAKKISDGSNTSDYSLGVNQSVNLEFVELKGVSIDITKVQIYEVGGENRNVSSFTYDKDSKKLSIRIDSSLASTIHNELLEINNKGKNPGDAGYVSDPFTRSNYNKYWTFEVYYNLSILDSTPSESMVTLVVSQDAQAK